MKNKFQTIESDNNYFASMTDLLVGVIFMFIILIMYLALQSNYEKSQKEKIFIELREKGISAEQFLNQIYELRYELSSYKKELETINSINIELKSKKEELQFKLDLLEKKYNKLISSDDEYFKLKEEYDKIILEFKSIENLFELKENLKGAEDKILQLTTGLKDQTIKYERMSHKVLSDYLYKIKNSLLKDEKFDIFIQKKDKYFLIKFQNYNQYKSGSAKAENKFNKQVLKFGDLLFKDIYCYINSGNKRDDFKCRGIENFKYFPGIDSIQLIGHTDDKRDENGELNCEGVICEKSAFKKSNNIQSDGNISSNDTRHSSNKLLAFRRANKIKDSKWSKFKTQINSLKNSRGFDVINVLSSAADELLIENAKSESDHAKNRRVEFKFLIEEIELDDVIRLNESIM